MDVKPTFAIKANSVDITATIAERFMELSLTDETGVTSDMLEITLANHEPCIQLPPTGAELELFLGYDGANERMGLFVCDEIEASGMPRKLVIRARGAIFDKTPKGKANLQSQKERSWAKGTKLADMVAKIAKEHGMEAVVSASLKSIVLPHIDQASESDLNLLVRIGKKYDAIVKPSDGKLIVAKRGESKSASGQTLPTITMTPTQVTNWRMLATARESSGTVVAYYHVTKSSKRNEVKVGKGEPVTRIKQYFPTSEMATAAAKADLAKRDRQKRTVSMTVPGRNDLAAECPLVLADFKDGSDGAYIITRVVHSVTKDGGYSCSIEAEMPTEGDAAASSAKDASVTIVTPKPVPPAPQPAPAEQQSLRQRLQAELDQVLADWKAEQERSFKMRDEAKQMAEDGIPGAAEKYAEAQQIFESAKQKYSPWAAQLEADLANLPK